MNVTSKSYVSPRDLAIIKDRLLQYDDPAVNPAAIRDKLVTRWREAHPAAAAERSESVRPLIRWAEWKKHAPDEPDEIWFNDIYHVTLRRREKDPVFGSSAGMIQLGINTHDGTARHDWREFQAIKNQLAGPETEAFELYPAESRLLDPSNYYSLWCFPGVRRLKVGVEIRDLRAQDVALSPQRGLPL